MGVMGALLAPGVEHRETADLGPEMLGGPSDILERLRHGTQEQPVEEAGGLQRQRPQGGRQGKDHMGVGRLEALLLPGSQPGGLRGAMTCGAAAVATGVIRLLFGPAVVAWRDMAPEGSGPTQRNGAEGPLRRAREDGPIGRPQGVTMLTHDLGHFQRRPTPGRVSRLAGKARASRGRSVAWSAGWATWR
jgi:hypothetical protein